MKSAATVCPKAPRPSRAAYQRSRSHFDCFKS